MNRERRDDFSPGAASRCSDRSSRAPPLPPDAGSRTCDALAKRKSLRRMFVTRRNYVRGPVRYEFTPAIARFDTSGAFSLRRAGILSLPAARYYPRCRRLLFPSRMEIRYARASREA